jgi:hypothetical protein
MHEMPRPNERHERLHRLAGTWVGEEILSPSPMGPGGGALGRVLTRLDVDGFFLIQDYIEERDGAVVYRGHGIIGWDETGQRYGWFWVDSMGTLPASPAWGHWSDDRTLIFEHAPVADQRSRYTYHLVDGQTLRFKIEISRDSGHSYATFLEGRYRRV